MASASLDIGTNNTISANNPLHTASESRVICRDQQHSLRDLLSSLRNGAEESNDTEFVYTDRSTLSGPGSAVQSVFEWDARSRGHSSVGRSSAPLQEPGYGWFPGLYGRPLSNHADDYYLWCEFSGLLDCTAIFPGDNEADWIQHHVDHFRGKYPSRLVCWFCDDHPPFEAHAGAEDFRNDREANFYLRMGHIKEHIYGDYLTRDNMRPDFHMIQHMYKHGLLAESEFRLAMSYTELPRSLQLPAEEDDRFQLPHLVCDLEKEERHRKRGERGRNSTRSLKQSIFEPVQGSGMGGSKMGRKREGSPVRSSQSTETEMFILRRIERLRSLDPASTSGGERAIRALRMRKRKDVTVILHGQHGADVLVRERKDLVDQGHYRAPPPRLNNGDSTTAKGKEVEYIPHSDSDRRRWRGIARPHLGQLLESHKTRRASVPSQAPSSVSGEHPRGSESLDSELLTLSEDTESVAELDPASPLHHTLSDIAERIVRDFYRWRHNPHREAPGNADTDGGSHSAQTHSQETTSGAGGASGSGVQRQGRERGSRIRQREQDGEKDDEGYQSERGAGKRLRAEDPLAGSRSLACPFWKRSPFDKHRACHRYKLSRIRDVKFHLTRKHTPTAYCQRCFAIFETEGNLSDHIRQDNCRIVPGSRLDGITPATDRLLRKRADKDQSVEDQWFAIWDIIFPGKERPFSPFVDTSLSTNLSNFREYFENHGRSTWDEVDAELERLEGLNAPNEVRRANRRRVMIMGMGRLYEIWVASQSSVSLQALSLAEVAPPSLPARSSPASGAGRSLRTGVSLNQQRHQPNIQSMQNMVVPVSAAGRTGSTTDGYGDTSSGTSRTDPGDDRQGTDGQGTQRPERHPEMPRAGPSPVMERLNFPWTDGLLPQQHGFHLPGGEQGMVSFDDLFALDALSDLQEQDGTFNPDFGAGFRIDETFDGGQRNLEPG